MRGKVRGEGMAFRTRPVGGENDSGWRKIWWKGKRGEVDYPILRVNRFLAMRSWKEYHFFPLSQSKHRKEKIQVDT